MKANTTSKRVSIVKVQLIREKSMLYSNRKIGCPDDAAELFRDYMGDLDRENFVLLCLNNKNEPTHIETVHVGNINSSIVTPREVLKTAILSNAAGAMLCHNHPSGNPCPSQEDVEVTERLKHAFELVGITLHDHIILGDEDHVSLRQSGHTRIW